MAKITMNSPQSWMGQLSGSLIRCPIIHLKIPGSHNTFSYTIKPDSTVSPDSPQIVQSLSHIFKFIVNPIIFKWSVTQNLDISNQLKIGIRYLDVRLVNRSDDLMVAHGLYGAPIFPLLDEVNSFLKENEKEAIILDFQHFYNFTPKNHSMLLNYLENKFASRLCMRRDSICDITLEGMRARGEQVIVLYRSNVQTTFVWPSDSWPTPWPNKIQVPDLLSFLNAMLEHRNEAIGMVTQCVLTVDSLYVMLHPFRNLKYLVRKTRSKILQWLKEIQYYPSINVVITDFVDIEFVATVLGIK